MPLHSGLTGASLHECKGVAAASAGDVQVANGSGGATWGDFDYRSMPTGAVVQMVDSTPNSTHSTTTTVIPNDDTIPQNTEGSEIATVTITPKATTHKLFIQFHFMGQISSADGAWAIFQDSTANALAAGYLNRSGVSNANAMSTSGGFMMAAGTTSATTFKLRCGPNSGGTLAVNGGTNGRDFGGVSACWIRVTEYKA
jgi:hypothetical protein